MGAGPAGDCAHRSSRHHGDMTILDRLSADLTTAMKARDTFTTNTLRQLLGEIRTQEKATATATPLTDPDVLTILTREAKKRRDTATIYTNAGATDRADTETREADLIDTYLPALIEGDALDALVTATIRTWPTPPTPRDMGHIIKHITAHATNTGTRVSGKDLAARVRDALTS